MKIVGASSEKLQDYCPNFISGQGVEDLEVFFVVISLTDLQQSCQTLAKCTSSAKGWYGETVIGIC